MYRSIIYYLWKINSLWQTCRYYGGKVLHNGETFQANPGKINNVEGILQTILYNTIGNVVRISGKLWMVY